MSGAASHKGRSATARVGVARKRLEQLVSARRRKRERANNTLERRNVV